MTAKMTDMLTHDRTGSIERSIAEPTTKEEARLNKFLNSDRGRKILRNAQKQIGVPMRYAVSGRVVKRLDGGDKL